MHEPHEIPPGGKVLEAMLMARQQMSQRIDRFDALVHKSRDRGWTERGLDRLLLEPMSAL